MGTKIKQNGYSFTYVYTYNGQKPIIEDWGLERVVAFMYLAEMHRQRSQKYTKDRTYMNRFGNQVYVFDDLEFDLETNKDINRLVKLVSKSMTPDKEQEYWLIHDWRAALDSMESYVKELVANAEKPVEVMGNTYTPPKFLSRPSEEEYKAKAEAQRKEEEARLAVMREQRVQRATMTTTAGKVAIGTHLKFNFIKYGVMECVVTGYSGRSYLVDVLRDGKVIETGWKFAYNSSRIVG